MQVNPLPRHGLPVLGQGASRDGVDERGLEFQEGLEHEGALQDSRVRQRQTRQLEGQVAVEEYVYVEGPGPLAALPGAVAAEAGLYGLGQPEELERLEPGLGRHGQVEEVRLVEYVERARAVDGARASAAQGLRQGGNGLAERVLAVTRVSA